MKIQVLLATMFFQDEEENYLTDMNIQTDIIIGNQCDITKDEFVDFNGYNVKILSRNERGVGKNRNLALFNSDADVVVFADNDIHYYDNYKSIIEEYYNSHPKADVVIFNFKEILKDGSHDINTKNKKAGLRDLTKFGTHAITAKRASIIKNRISFSVLFGGGATYSCGEDSLFLKDCHSKGLNIYLCDKTLGEIIPRKSTWFNGITEKYVYDKGALFKAMKPKLYLPVIIYHAVKHRTKYREFGPLKLIIKTMLKGAKGYDNAI